MKKCLRGLWNTIKDCTGKSEPVNTTAHGAGGAKEKAPVRESTLFYLSGVRSQELAYQGRSFDHSLRFQGRE